MKNKRIVIIIAVIAVIVLSVISIILFLGKEKSTPEEVLKQYMSYILEKDYNAMYELTTKNTIQEEYVNRNKNIYEGIEVSKIDTNIVKTSEKGKEAEIVYTTTMSTIAGEISFSNTANFIKENGTYKIKWSSNNIFPSLKDDYKVRVQTLQAQRGVIFDKNGNILAANQTASQVGLVPGRMNEVSKEQDIKIISNLLDISVDSIKESLSASYVQEDTFVPLRTILKSETNLKEQLLQVRGIKIIDKEERVYNLGEAASQLIGYVQTINAEELEEKKDQGYTKNSVIGKTGIEKKYEEKLRAMDGAEIYIEDANGKKVKTLAKKNLKNGESIKLTIDSTIQQIIYEKFKEDKSASVAINPKTGEILAAVSTPTFDSNDFSLGMTANKWKELSESKDKPLYNRFLASYAPGSSFKPITGAIGLTTRSFTAEEDFGPSGTKWQKDANWKDFYVTTLKTYKGEANLKNALIYSDNIYFAKAVKVGKENFAKSLKSISFNTEIQTPLGNVKSTYSNTDTFETETQLANSGYGQAEVLVNPIHMAMIYSGFVNNGNIVNLYLDYTGDRAATYFREEAFSKEAANKVKEALIQVVEDPNGTAHSAKIEELIVAGKTGTAEIKTSKDDKKGTEIGWYNTFVADENSGKQLLVVSMVEDVKEKGGSHYVVEKLKDIFRYEYEQ